MINDERLIETLQKCIFKKIQLPTSAKFSQFDCYEEKRREMDRIIAGIENLKKTTQLAEVLTSDTVMAELESKYGSNALKSDELANTLPAEKLSSATIDYDTYLNYNENELFRAPDIINTILTNTNPTVDVGHLFLYGVKNPESFYKAILVATKSEFITKTKQNRSIDIFKFKKELGVSVGELDRIKEYSKLSSKLFDSNLIKTNLVDKETYVDDALIQVIADWLGKSVIVYDMINKKYSVYRTKFWETETVGDAYFIIEYQGAYCPCIYVSQRNLFNGDKLASYLAQQYECITTDLYKLHDGEIARKKGPRSALADPYLNLTANLPRVMEDMTKIQNTVASAIAEKKVKVKIPPANKAKAIDKEIVTAPISIIPAPINIIPAPSNTTPTTPTDTTKLKLKAISAYKMEELLELAKSVGVETMQVITATNSDNLTATPKLKNRLKADIYEDLKKAIS